MPNNSISMLYKTKHYYLLQIHQYFMSLFTKKEINNNYQCG